MKKEMILPMTEVPKKRSLNPWDLTIFIGSFIFGMYCLIFWSQTWEWPILLASIGSLAVSALWGGVLLDQVSSGEKSHE